MDVARLQQILTDLETRSAGELESQTLEFKSWCRDEKNLCGELAEAAVCLANADGGFVIIGVQDRNVGRRAASTCPYRAVTADWIRAKVREFTTPPVCGELLIFKQKQQFATDRSASMPATLWAAKRNRQTFRHIRNFQQAQDERVIRAAP
ncbi:MAG: helix-turn-helix domain-containing protein [Candidatus Binataceae bacterium]